VDTSVFENLEPNSQLVSFNASRMKI